jgi:CheY-like chemotaxis protein
MNVYEQIRQNGTISPKLSEVRVLVVENVLAIAMDLDELLQSAGYLVIGPVSSMAEASVLIDCIDCAVLDINLRDGNVFPFADLLRSKRIPFMFLTGYAPNMIMPERFKDTTCLEKPFLELKLLNTVKYMANVARWRKR